MIYRPCPCQTHYLHRSSDFCVHPAIYLHLDSELSNQTGTPLFQLLLTFLGLVPLVYSIRGHRARSELQRQWREQLSRRFPSYCCRDRVWGGGGGGSESDKPPKRATH